MLKKVLAPTAIAIALATPAFAATTTNNNGSSSATPGASSNQSQGGEQATAPAIAQKLHNGLAQAGFTDIHVMPQSFLVRAKDQDGNPVMMIINPDSMTAVTALGSSGNNTNGSLSGSGASGAANSQKQ
jgi:hypothetical protein